MDFGRCEAKKLIKQWISPFIISEKFGNVGVRKRQR